MLQHEETTRSTLVEDILNLIQLAKLLNERSLKLSEYQHQRLQFNVHFGFGS